MGSTNITTLTRGTYLKAPWKAKRISSLEALNARDASVTPTGNGRKYGWSAEASGNLYAGGPQLVRLGIIESTDGQQRPREINMQVRLRSIMSTQVHSVKYPDEDDTDNAEEQQGLAEELQDAGASPTLDIAVTMYRLDTAR